MEHEALSIEVKSRKVLPVWRSKKLRGGGSRGPPYAAFAKPRGTPGERLRCRALPLLGPFSAQNGRRMKEKRNKSESWSLLRGRPFCRLVPSSLSARTRNPRIYDKKGEFLMSGKRLSKEQRESITQEIRAKRKSFQQISREHLVSISTVSRIAAELGLSSPRKKTKPAEVPEQSYDRAQRISALDRIAHSIDTTVANGGLSSRQLKDLASAAQVVYAARRAEDLLEPSEAAEDVEKPKPLLWYPVDPDDRDAWGDLGFDLSSDLGRELFVSEMKSLGLPGHFGGSR